MTKTLHFPETPFEQAPLESLSTTALIALQREIESRQAVIRNKLAEMKTDWVTYRIKTPEFERAELSESLTVLGNQYAAIRAIRTERSQRREIEARDHKAHQKLKKDANALKWAYTDALLAHLMVVVEESGRHDLIAEARRRVERLEKEQWKPSVSAIFGALQASHGATLIPCGEPFSPWGK